MPDRGGLNLFTVGIFLLEMQIIEFTAAPGNWMYDSIESPRFAALRVNFFEALKRRGHH